MSTEATKVEVPEFAALNIVYNALKPLTPDAQERVLAYVSQMLNVTVPSRSSEPYGETPVRPRSDNPTPTHETSGATSAEDLD